jgi:hypothetical protein
MMLLSQSAESSWHERVTLDERIYIKCVVGSYSFNEPRVMHRATNTWLKSSDGL